MKEDTNQALIEGRWQDGIGLIEEELSNDPENPEVLAYNLVVCYVKLGKLDEAKSAYSANKRFLSKADRISLQGELGIPAEKAPRKEQPREGKATVVDNELKSLDWFKPETKFAEVIGLERVKKQLTEKVIRAMQRPEVYREYGAPISAGVLLYGPPGTGKSLLARACAGETAGKMLIARISEIESKYHGESSRNIRVLFEQARQKGPAIVFIDELDAMAPNRAKVGDIAGGTEERATINTFLTELDGVSKANSGVFVLGATNRPWDIDAAFRRQGRMGKSIYVAPPNTKDRKNLFIFYLKDKKIAKINYMKLALLTMGFTPDDIKSVCSSVAEKKAFSATEGKGAGPITTRELVGEVARFGDPVIFEWYAQTLEEMRKLPPESLRQYKDLKRDIEFWHTRGKSRARLYRVIGSLLR